MHINNGHISIICIFNILELILKQLMKTIASNSQVLLLSEKYIIDNIFKKNLQKFKNFSWL